MRPKFLLRMLNQSARSSTKKGSANEEEEGSEEELSDDDSKGKSKVVQSLNFGGARKAMHAGGPSPLYVTRFVIACEEICGRDAKLLAAFHAAMQKLLPLNPANLSGIVTAMERVFDGVYAGIFGGEEKGSGARVVDRVSRTLHAVNMS